MKKTIRIAEHKDVEVINEIYNQAIDTRCSTGDHEHIPIGERQKWFEEHTPDKYPVLVCESENDILGWVCLSPYRYGRSGFRRAVEVSYYVHNGHKQKGIGSLLLKAIIEKAGELNYKVLIAMLFDTNTGSIKLLEKYGFERWGCLYDVIEIDDVIFNHLCYGLKVSG